MSPGGFEDCAKCGKPIVERKGDLCDGCTVLFNEGRREIRVRGDKAQKRLGEL
jgi:hypothetical protein